MLALVVLLRFALLFFLSNESLHVTAFTLIHHGGRSQYRHHRPCTTRHSSLTEQQQEAVQALAEYHGGTWQSTCVHSFTITNDMAAGIVKRKQQPYSTTTTVHKELSWTEEMSMQMDAVAVTPSRDSDDSTVTKEWKREVDFEECNMDVDSVDASYSLDQRDITLPVEWTGPLLSNTRNEQDTTTTAMTIDLCIEHCLTASNDRRIRCWVLYGGADERLLRVIVAHEERVVVDLVGAATQQQQPVSSDTFTAQDFIEMQSDMDRLVDKITGKADATNPLQKKNMDRLQAAMATNNDHDEQQRLKPHSLTLLELTTLGVWLGDAVIRDHPQVLMTPMGFAKKEKQQRGQQLQQFATWTLGVQKVAWQWQWPSFGDTIVAMTDQGRAMGASGVALPRQKSGDIVVNESLSRRIQNPADRMVCIDWAEEGTVGFWVGGCVGIQVPKYMKFDATRRIRPFYTELSLIQKGEGRNDEIVCSKMSRIYNYKGQLKQALTAFYSLQLEDAK